MNAASTRYYERRRDGSANIFDPKISLRTDLDAVRDRRRCRRVGKIVSRAGHNIRPCARQYLPQVRAAPVRDNNIIYCYNASHAYTYKRLFWSSRAHVSRTRNKSCLVNIVIISWVFARLRLPRPRRTFCVAIVAARAVIVTPLQIEEFRNGDRPGADFAIPSRRLRARGCVCSGYGWRGGGVSVNPSTGVQKSHPGGYLCTVCMYYTNTRVVVQTRAGGVTYWFSREPKKTPLHARPVYGAAEEGLTNVSKQGSNVTPNSMVYVVPIPFRHPEGNFFRTCVLRPKRIPSIVCWFPNDTRPYEYVDSYKRFWYSTTKILNLKSTVCDGLNDLEVLTTQDTNAIRIKQNITFAQNRYLQNYRTR